jgi:hypothetical protein
MKHLIVLLLTLAHGGHWLGGHTESISIAWPAKSGMPAAAIHWQCSMGTVSLASGNASMPDAAHPLIISLAVPHVRVTTRVHFSCTARDKNNDTKIAGGEGDIVVYPDQLVGTFEKMYTGKRVVLLDHSKSILKLLDQAKIHADPILDLSQLLLRQTDVLIVGPDELKSSPLQQPALLPMASKGCQIIILRQRDVTTIAGYHLSQREVLSNLIWTTDHPLLAHLDTDTLQTWIGNTTTPAIRVPAGDASLEVGYWKPEAHSQSPSPIDALLMTSTIGTGRLVFCQLPADDWANDPRSQILLRNILSYATTRPEPTPRSDQRTTQRVVRVIPQPNILAPVGD